jgi:UPF0716 protein FxsA
MKWFFLFLTVPILEITVFFKINEIIGTLYTISSIIATALIGTLIVQQQGKDIIFRLKNKSRNLTLLLGNGVLILISGVLLLTPGFVTDTVGFLLLVPLLRQKALIFLKKKFIPS